MVHGALPGVCYDIAHLSRYHILWVQGTGGYFRTFHGNRGVFRQDGRHLGTGFA